MRVHTRIAAAGVAGLVGVAGVALVTAPLASAATDTGEVTVLSRLDAIRDALAGLVDDGSLTPEQADEVAATLDGSDALRGHGHHGGHGGPGPDLDAAAEVLGMTTDGLRTALGVDGTSLADVAEAQGVDPQALVDALVTAGTERIEQAVVDGRLTRAEADERIAALPERVADLVQTELRVGGHGHGPQRGGHGPTDDDPSAEDPTGGGATDGATSTEDAVPSGTTAV